jgi:hypothetical protein
LKQQAQRGQRAGKRWLCDRWGEPKIPARPVDIALSDIDRFIGGERKVRHSQDGLGEEKEEQHKGEGIPSLCHGHRKSRI